MEFKYDVFISYSRKDYTDENKNVIPGNVISAIKERLKEENISYWFDEDGIRPSDTFPGILAANIIASKMILFVSSENSNMSQWTCSEIAVATKYKRRIIPFKIDKSDYGISLEIYLAPIDFIDYTVNPQKAMDSLVGAIKENIKDLELEEQKTKIKQEIASLDDDISKEHACVKAIITKLASLNVLDKTCPVCSTKIKIGQSFCDKCGFYFQPLYGYPGARNHVDKAYIDIVKKIWNASQCHEEAAAVPEMDNKHRKEKGLFMVNNVGFKMIPVEGGSFIMVDENNSRKVTLSSFKISETPVTQALWKSVMGENPSMFIGDNRPVEQVSWNDCVKFIEKLNKLTGKEFRLPSESEWEFAARGGNKGMKTVYAGGDDINAVGWCNGDESGTHDVKAKSPNELRIYDMSGNVWEWCADWYDKYNTFKVCRGGGWDSEPQSCSVSARNYGGSCRRSNNVGFRLAL